MAVSLADTSVTVWDTAPWRVKINEQLAKSVPADLGPLWADLAGDAATGLRAARLLGAAGDRGVALFKEKVSVPSPPDAAAVKRLIADLDSPRFAVREQAEADLRDLGEQAVSHLRRALRAKPSAEATRRIEALLAVVESGKLPPPRLRELRAVQALVWMDTPAARGLLTEWAKGDPAAALTKAAQSAGR